MTTLNELVKELLDNNIDIQRSFFESDHPQKSKYLVVGDLEDVFLDRADDIGVTFEHMANHGGEGDGDQYWSVYKFHKGSDSVFVKFNGSYASYDGSCYDEWYFVQGKVVEVVEYSRIK